MNSSQRRLLVDLISSTSRVTRIAAVASGDTTPASQWRLLSVLASDGPQRIGEIAAVLRISQPAITQFVPTLEAQNLVTRESDPGDARASVLVITAEGRQALDDWKGELGGALAPLFANLTDEDWAALGRTAVLFGRAAEVTA